MVLFLLLLLGAGSARCADEDEQELKKREVRRRESSGDVGKLVKTKRPIPGTAKRTFVRTKKRERLVPDPKGSIVREHPAVNHPEIWQRTFLGQNALALYAVLKCGIEQTEPRITRLAEGLNESLETFGLPDTTWEVSWLTAAFLHLKGDRYEKTRDALVRKLLEGQITEGPARGLWGVICINPELLSAMMAYDQSLATEVERRKKIHLSKPDSMTALRKLEAIQTAHEVFSDHYKRVSQQGLRFREVTRGWRVPIDMSPEPLTIYGLPYYFYSQSIADIETSALALYVLRVAAEEGHLPEEVVRPELSDKRRLLPAQKTSSILARAASAIAKLQDRVGCWPEGNIHQAVSYFNPIGVEQLTRDEILSLPADYTLLSTVQAFAGLLDAGRAVGVKTPDIFVERLAAVQSLDRIAEVPSPATPPEALPPPESKGEPAQEKAQSEALEPEAPVKEEPAIPPPPLAQWIFSRL